MQAHLAATDLACRRGERVLFRGVSLALGPGAACRIAGPNGIGKTSLIRILAGLLRPLAGTGERRGAIRAKLLDWLAASPYADRIAAVRPAQQRHGGSGAVYIVLRRAR